MRIIKNIEEPITKFEDLMIGDVFLDRDGHVCIKTPKVYNDFSKMEIESFLEGCITADDFYEHEANSYDFEIKEFFWIDNNEQVRPLKATMEVK